MASTSWATGSTRCRCSPASENATANRPGTSRADTIRMLPARAVRRGALTENPVVLSHPVQCRYSVGSHRRRCYTGWVTIEPLDPHTADPADLAACHAARAAHVTTDLPGE